MGFIAIFEGINLVRMFNLAGKLAQRVTQRKNLGFAEQVFLESQVLVPKDTLALMRSGKVTSSGNSNIFISYNTHYAMRVHEDLMMRHAAGTQAKYLEQPARKLFEDIDVFFRDFNVEVGLN